MSMGPSVSVASPEAVAPAPWGLKGKAWILPYWAPGKQLPADAYPAEERGTRYADQTVNGRFKAGYGFIQIIRYTETEVGPYDEIILIPGWFESPVSSSTAPRITTIYVSTEVSVRNGRKNWGIPKYLADFSFTDAPNGGTLVRVSHPGASTPFFAATLTPTKWVPSMPISQYVPLPSLVQPPIPAPEDPSSMLQGCAEWFKVSPAFGGWARLVSTKPAREDGTMGDGQGFTATKPVTWALEVTSFSGVFPEGQVLQENKKTK